ncbi:DUF6568 family protein [Enterococcus hirae]|uniref:DUF6568 family protein n=1 Tax=Enterococcus hirae TaxID=1354 RepID=UPI001377213B|nr:DUF6568 family protein [Enterococcus hirae]NBA57119.1 hypothetical protein [Enterococcus hirae]
MNKKIFFKVIVPIFLSFIVVATVFPIYNHFSKYQSMKRYEEIVNTFVPVSDNMLLQYNDLIDKDYLLYFGRESCANCREFIYELKKKSEGRNLSVFYIDTEHADKNSNISNLCNKLNIEFIPSVLYVSNGKVSLFNGEKLTFEDFLNQMKK